MLVGDRNEEKAVVRLLVEVSWGAGCQILNTYVISADIV